jgi:tight adherence protein C
VIAALVGVAVFLGVVAVRRPPLTSMVGRYVRPDGADRPSGRRLVVVLPEILIGSIVGAALLPVGVLPGTVVGTGLGYLFARIRRRSIARARERRLGQELPTVADLCALYVLSGDSVVAALRRLTVDARGIAVDEIATILARLDAGLGFPEAAREAARSSAHRDGARFYELLAQAHRSGSRLADSLQVFATDRRAALEREMAVEGGRRALTGYGPILGLMIPTTLVFLMYPTLAGLDALSPPR